MQTKFAVVEVDPSFLIMMECKGHTQTIHQEDCVRIHLHNIFVKKIAFVLKNTVPNFEEDLCVQGCTWVMRYQATDYFKPRKIHKS
jgi:hypothetical protein